MKIGIYLKTLKITIKMIYLLLACVAAPAADFPTVVEFYAPWCPVCQRFEKEWIEAASLLSSQVTFSRVDCDAELETCNDWQITEYPTIVILDNTVSSTFTTYTGPLTSESLTSWAQVIDTTTTAPSPVTNPPGNVNDVLWGINETLSHVKAPVNKVLASHIRTYLRFVAELFPEYAAVSSVANRKLMLETFFSNLQRPISSETWQLATQQFPATSKRGRACTTARAR